MEKEFGAYKRGSHHSAPEKEADVALLTSQYVESALHVYKPGRKLSNAKAGVVNIVDNGSKGLEGIVKDWFKRRSLKRSVKEIWITSQENDEGIQDGMEI